MYTLKLEASLGELNKKVESLGNMEMPQPEEDTKVEGGRKQSDMSMSNNTSDVFIISEMCHNNNMQEAS